MIFFWGGGGGEEGGSGEEGDCSRTFDLFIHVKRNILVPRPAVLVPKNICGRGSPGPARRSLGEMRDFPQSYSLIECAIK